MDWFLAIVALILLWIANGIVHGQVQFLTERVDELEKLIKKLEEK